jgi:glycosyltransferase involved in cell wall biosynthesis
MQVTVILCTYNRVGSLAAALESIGNSCDHASVQSEILIVDNNSTDDTRPFAESLCRQHPGRFRYLFEPNQGLSNARNAGIREARGEILAFTDDDVTVEPTWLENLTTGLNDEKWAGAGGRTLPRQLVPLPAWISSESPQDWGGIVGGLFDLGDISGELAVAPYGANMAFRKAMFERYGMFRADLGRCGNQLISLEDMEFGRRLMAAGEHLRYEPSAIVYHPILENRLQKDYFLSWWFGFGRAVIREKGKRAPILGLPRHYFGIPKMTAVNLPIFALRWMCTMKQRDRFRSKCLTWYMAGQIAETYRMARLPCGNPRVKTEEQSAT